MAIHWDDPRINPIYNLEFEILISKENMYDQLIATGEHFSYSLWGNNGGTVLISWRTESSEEIWDKDPHVNPIFQCQKHNDAKHSIFLTTLSFHIYPQILYATRPLQENSASKIIPNSPEASFQIYPAFKYHCLFTSITERRSSWQAS